MNPWIVEHVISPGLERLLRRRTFHYRRDLMKSQWWEREKLDELQLRKLRSLVSIALNQTAAYAELAGVGRTWLPESLADLQRLPFLDKPTLNRLREELVNRDVRGGPIRYSTGGSTGTPLIFYFDKRRQAYDKAARMRAHQWWGIRLGDREAYIWGSPVELSKQDRLKHFRDRLTNEMLLSASDLSEAAIGSFVERLHRFRPKCLFGYPSSIAVMCQLARRAGLGLSDLPVNVVFSTAEVLYDHQKETISHAFGGVPVANRYGSREGGSIADECPEGRMHITGENIILEFIKDGQPVGAGEDGEIVVTHLDNHAMPFIRYRTGDVGQPSDEICPCGRGLQTMKIVKGRITDLIITPDGRWVSGHAVEYVVRDILGIREYQFLQRDVDSICVRIVLDEGFPSDGQERIREGITKWLGANVRVDVEEVSEIARAPSGKYRFVISQVARDRQALL